MISTVIFLMGDINVDDALTGKMVEDQDDCDISYTQKGTGGNLVIQTDSGNIRLKCSNQITKDYQRGTPYVFSEKEKRK